jgi:hypothetical protein
MNHIQHKLCNDVLGAPPGEENACDALHIQRATTNYGPDVVPCVVSYWKPTSRELAMLINGGCIQLAIIGNNHPPLSVDVVQS